ncbi:hypothetical protein GCM10025788_26430 [Serinicoccus chungangensis]
MPESAHVAVLIWGTGKTEAPPGTREGASDLGGGEGTRTPNPLLPRENGKALDRHTVTRFINRAGTAAGLGHINPHQLRHTLATQAINRGRSLEAIAAMLGHKSMDMTLVHAKIANRTVADEYFAVADQVEALYARPAQLPADALGPNMAHLSREYSRLLGNGYCTRRAAMDCVYETVCESAPSSRPPSPSAPPCTPSATTPPPRARPAAPRSTTTCSPASTTTRPLDTRYLHNADVRMFRSVRGSGRTGRLVNVHGRVLTYQGSGAGRSPDIERPSATHPRWTSVTPWQGTVTPRTYLAPERSPGTYRHANDSPSAPHTESPCWSGLSPLR